MFQIFNRIGNRLFYKAFVFEILGNCSHTFASGLYKPQDVEATTETKTVPNNKFLRVTVLNIVKRIKATSDL